MQSKYTTVAFGSWDALVGLGYVSTIHLVRYRGKRHSTRDIFWSTEAPMGEDKYTEPLLFPLQKLIWAGQVVTL